MKKSELQINLIREVQRYRIDNHKSIDQGIDDAIAALVESKEHRTRRKLLTESEWKRSKPVAKKVWFPRWPWGKKVVA